MNKKLTALLLTATVIGSQTVCVNAAEKTITVAKTVLTTLENSFICNTS